jgi:hypothetical protein
VCPPEVRFDGFIRGRDENMMVIGADTHKSTHTFAAVDAARSHPIMLVDGHRIL